MTTEYYILCVLIAIPSFMFMAFVFAFVFCAVYDAWYSYKYRTWIALKKDHSKPKRPAAK